jgi:hypothetical protein
MKLKKNKNNKKLLKEELELVEWDRDVQGVWLDQEELRKKKKRVKRILKEKPKKKRNKRTY